MIGAFRLVEPRFLPPLDAEFRPAALANREYRREVEKSGGGVPLVFGLERPDRSVSRYETQVFPPDHPRAEANLRFAERTFKFLLWQRGGWKAYIGGPRSIGDGELRARLSLLRYTGDLPIAPYTARAIPRT